MNTDSFQQKLKDNGQQPSSSGIHIERQVTDSSSESDLTHTTEEKQNHYSNDWLEDLNRKVESLQLKAAQSSGLNDQIDNINAAIIDAQKQITKLKKDNDNLKQELIAIAKQNTKESLEILGIFISLFTFISISASIVLQFETVFHAAFILMLFLIGLMTFLYLFHHLVHGEHRPLKKIYYFNRRFTWKIFLLHHWKTGTYSFLIPFVLAMILGVICLFFDAEIGPSSKQLEPANINYIQNMPTSKIRLDENVKQYNTSPASALPKPPMNSSVAK